MYRPLTTNLYYHIGNKLFGDRIEPYHAANDAFVILGAVALWHLAESFVGPWIALVEPLLFASRRLAPDAWILELAASATVRIGLAIVIASGVVVLAFPMLLRGYLRLFAFGFGWFFITMAPFVVFGDRLFLRYSIMGHAGIALAVTALTAIFLLPRGKLLALASSYFTAVPSC